MHLVKSLNLAQTTHPAQLPYNTGNTTKQLLEKETGKLNVLDILSLFVMPSPPPPSCCLCPEVEYNAGTTTLKTENVIGYVTDIVLSPLLVSEDNPHCSHNRQWGFDTTSNYDISPLKGFSFYHGSDIRNCKLYWFAIGK